MPARRSNDALVLCSLAVNKQLTRDFMGTPCMPSHMLRDAAGSSAMHAECAHLQYKYVHAAIGEVFYFIDHRPVSALYNSM